MINNIKENFKKGDRIKLIHMDDIQAPKPGTLGTVSHVDDMGQVHMKWDNGSSLALIPDEDVYEKIIDKEMIKVMGYTNKVKNSDIFNLFKNVFGSYNFGFVRSEENLEKIKNKKEEIDDEIIEATLLEYFTDDKVLIEEKALTKNYYIFNFEELTFLLQEEKNGVKTTLKELLETMNNDGIEFIVFK